MRRDPQVEHVLHALTDDAAWLAQQLVDIHELAYGPSSNNPDVVVQTFADHDVSDLIGSHAQSLWAQLRDLADRIVTLRRTCEQLWGHERPEWRPRQRDMDRPTRQSLQAAQDRRRARGEWTPTRIVHGGDER